MHHGFYEFKFAAENIKQLFFKTKKKRIKKSEETIFFLNNTVTITKQTFYFVCVLPFGDEDTFFKT